MKHRKHALKTARIAALTAVAGLLTLPLASAFAGEPVCVTKAPIEKLCEIPGLYKEYPQGDMGIIITCHVVSTKACLYLPGPCNGQGPVQGNYGNTVPAPVALDLEEGQKFFARYNDQGEFLVTLINSYELTDTVNEDGSVTLTFTYK